MNIRKKSVFQKWYAEYPRWKPCNKIDSIKVISPKSREWKHDWWVSPLSSSVLFLPQELLRWHPLWVSPRGPSQSLGGWAGKPIGWNISFVTQILSLEYRVTTYPTLLGLFKHTFLNSGIWQRCEPQTDPTLKKLGPSSASLMDHQ